MMGNVIEHVRWRGSNYESGIDGQHLAIVGYSHWLGENESDSDAATNDDVSKVISGEYKTAFFFDQIKNYFNFASRRAFWDRVIFLNLLPNCVGNADARYDSGTHEQVERAKDRLLRIFREDRPDKALVFTSRGWAQFPSVREKTRLPLGEEFPGFSWGTYDAGGIVTALAYVTHKGRGAT